MKWVINLYIFAIIFIKECKLLCDAKRKIDMNDFADDDEEGCYDYSLLTALRYIITDYRI